MHKYLNMNVEKLFRLRISNCGQKNGNLKFMIMIICVIKVVILWQKLNKIKLKKERETVSKEK
ncbi:hypothetical protein BpHYR1_000059 [Brachionus plicatilis]|uniref:Uncharacterized protein n=1 Tax=Brachionus plicatilis TaxID=10195 RepID=A0A3M7PUF5_BRAPC|nr:hypothetical protein BpHYR1_000059 [Brachionus plicatilis]